MSQLIEPLLTAQQVATRLSCHVKTVYRIPEDELPRVKLPGRGRQPKSLRFRAADVEKFIDRQLGGGK